MFTEFVPNTATCSNQEAFCRSSLARTLNVNRISLPTTRTFMRPNWLAINTHTHIHTHTSECFKALIKHRCPVFCVLHTSCTQKSALCVTNCATQAAPGAAAKKTNHRNRVTWNGCLLMALACSRTRYWWVSKCTEFPLTSASSLIAKPPMDAST
jgi:hypothetical protein